MTTRVLFITSLQNYIRIDNYLINLLYSKQTYYGSIYSLEIIELERLKIYIKINIASNFIKHFKSYTNILILFFQKKRIVLAYI